jgi:hypothetical protein
MMAAATYQSNMVGKAASIILHMRRTGEMWKHVEQDRMAEWFGNEVCHRLITKPIKVRMAQSIVGTFVQPVQMPRRNFLPIFLQG